MVFVNFVAAYSAIPGWSKHTHDQNIPYGLTYVDLWMCTGGSSEGLVMES
jgi:hypothetical protein